MSVRIAVVYEADADFRIATELADRILCDSIDWLEEGHLDSQRTWINVNGQNQPLTWKGIKDLARRSGIRSHGHFDGEPGMPDAIAARRAIQYVLQEFDKLAGVILIRDQDDQPERKTGLEQARSEARNSLKIVIGLAIIERESWVISGFDPRTDDERTRLKNEHETLGFPPHEQSHKMSSCKDLDFRTFSRCREPSSKRNGEISQCRPTAFI